MISEPQYPQKYGGRLLNGKPNRTPYEYIDGEILAMTLEGLFLITALLSTCIQL